MLPLVLTCPMTGPFRIYFSVGNWHPLIAVNGIILLLSRGMFPCYQGGNSVKLAFIAFNKPEIVGFYFISLTDAYAISCFVALSP